MKKLLALGALGMMLASVSFGAGTARHHRHRRHYVRHHYVHRHHSHALIHIKL